MIAPSESTGKSLFSMTNDNDSVPSDQCFQPIGLRQLLEHLCADDPQLECPEAMTKAIETPIHANSGSSPSTPE